MTFPVFGDQDLNSQTSWASQYTHNISTGSKHEQLGHQIHQCRLYNKMALGMGRITFIMQFIVWFREGSGEGFRSLTTETYLIKNRVVSKVRAHLEYQRIDNITDYWLLPPDLLKYINKLLLKFYLQQYIINKCLWNLGINHLEKSPLTPGYHKYKQPMHYFS